MRAEPWSARKPSWSRCWAPRSTPTSPARCRGSATCSKPRATSQVRVGPWSVRSPLGAKCWARKSTRTSPPRCTRLAPCSTPKATIAGCAPGPGALARHQSQGAGHGRAPFRRRLIARARHYPSGPGRTLAGAHRTLERSLDITAKVVGTEHPDTAASWEALGVVLHAQGDLAGARKALERSLAIWVKVVGTEEHPDVATIYDALGGVLVSEGRSEQAVAAYRRAARYPRQVFWHARPRYMSARRPRCRSRCTALRPRPSRQRKPAMLRTSYALRVLAEQVPGHPYLRYPQFLALVQRRQTEEPTASYELDVRRLPLRQRQTLPRVPRDHRRPTAALTAPPAASRAPHIPGWTRAPSRLARPPRPPAACEPTSTREPLR